jgi:hypothetical protein
MEQVIDGYFSDDDQPEFLKKLMPVLKKFDRELIGAYRRFRHGFKTATGCETDYRIIVEHPDLGGFVLDATGRHPFGPSKTADDFTTAAPTEPLREVMH